MRSVIWLESGDVVLSRSGRSGAETVLHRASGPSWLAEASIFSDAYHCDAVALTGVVCRILPRAEFLGRAAPEADGVALGLLRHLARELRDARARAELLTLKTVAERLDAWGDAFGPKPSSLSWARVAEEIGVSPEALYRERAKRRVQTVR